MPECTSQPHCHRSLARDLLSESTDENPLAQASLGELELLQEEHHLRSFHPTMQMVLTSFGHPYADPIQALSIKNSSCSFGTFKSRSSSLSVRYQLNPIQVRRILQIDNLKEGRCVTD